MWKVFWSKFSSLKVQSTPSFTYFVHLANSCRQYPSFFLVLNRSSHMKTINYTFAPGFVFKLIKYRKGIVESITLKASAIHSALSVFCKNTLFNHNLCEFYSNNKSLHWGILPIKDSICHFLYLFAHWFVGRKRDEIWLSWFISASRHRDKFLSDLYFLLRLSCCGKFMNLRRA